MERRNVSQITRRDFEQMFGDAVVQADRILQDRGRAEEVASEALGRVFAEGKDRTKFKLIVHGLAVDAYRKLQREQVGGDLAELEMLEDDGFDVLWQMPPLTIEQAEFRADFDMALRNIPIELDRQAFLLTTVRGLTYREAAHILDIDEKSVRRHAERARAQIKEAIA